VGLPGGIADLYPHQLSGGMRQRVAIAAALAPRPQVLIADEPTTALDAQTRQEVLDLLESLRRRLGLTVVLVTHDLPLARRHADWLAVFQGGEVVEFGSAEQVWAAPRAAHTRELLGAATVGELGDRADAAPAAVGTGADRLCGGPVCPALKAADVVEALRVSKTYPGATGPALRAASIRVGAGEVVGVVGESGSGKTTLARLLLGLERPDSGQIRWWDGNGQPVAWNARLGQLVFQNPFASLNPAMTARAAVAEALAATGQDPERAGELLRLAGLGLELADRKPRQLSGGERQRVAIARALAPGPRLLIADEAVSALDAAVQARVLETLESLRTELGMAVLFISHDLAAVARLADRVYVMLAGEVVESGPTAKVLSSPAHQYTQRLVTAARADRPERSEW
jgi:peptide/nickel transport system ATP-binding protein